MSIECLFFLCDGAYQSNNVKVMKIGCGIKVISKAFGSRLGPSPSRRINDYLAFDVWSRRGRPNSTFNGCFKKSKMMMGVLTINTNGHVAHH